MADIPGLIDGAHRNRGLGHEFLRHVSRTRALMFVVDAAGSEGRDPVEDFESLKEELRLYDGELAGKPAFVVANKTDLEGESWGGVVWILVGSGEENVWFRFVHARCNRPVDVD